MSKIIKLNVDNFQNVATGLQNFGEYWVSSDHSTSSNSSRSVASKSIYLRGDGKYQDVNGRKVLDSKILSFLGSFEGQASTDIETQSASVKWLESVPYGLAPGPDMLGGQLCHFNYGTPNPKWPPESIKGCPPKKDNCPPKKDDCPPKKDECPSPKRCPPKKDNCPPKEDKCPPPKKCPKPKKCPSRKKEGPCAPPPKKNPCSCSASCTSTEKCFFSTISPVVCDKCGDKKPPSKPCSPSCPCSEPNPSGSPEPRPKPDLCNPKPPPPKPVQSKCCPPSDCCGHGRLPPLPPTKRNLHTYVTTNYENVKPWEPEDHTILNNFGKSWASYKPSMSCWSRYVAQKPKAFYDGKLYQSREITRRNSFDTNIFSLHDSRGIISKTASVPYSLVQDPEPYENPNYDLYYDIPNPKCPPDSPKTCPSKEQKKDDDPYCPKKEEKKPPKCPCPCPCPPPKCPPPNKEPLCPQPKKCSCSDSYVKPRRLTNAEIKCFVSTVGSAVCDKDKCGGLRKPPCKPCSPSIPTCRPKRDPCACPPVRQDPCAGPKPKAKPEPCAPKPPTCTLPKPSKDPSKPNCRFCVPRVYPTWPPKKSFNT